MSYRCAALAAIFATLVCGCATYTTPGGAVSIPQITEGGVAEALARKPAASFPARLIVARVQAANYTSYSNRGYGAGRYSVLTNRDVESEADFARLGAMKGVAAVGTLNRLLLQAVSLGFFPNKKSWVTSTCAAAFIDVRTGFVYGLAESTVTESQRSDLWSTQSAIEKARFAAEGAAFRAALGEIERTWDAIQREYAGAR